MLMMLDLPGRRPVCGVEIVAADAHDAGFFGVETAGLEGVLLMLALARVRTDVWCKSVAADAHDACRGYCHR